MAVGRARGPSLPTSARQRTSLNRSGTVTCGRNTREFLARTPVCSPYARCVTYRCCTRGTACEARYRAGERRTPPSPLAYVCAQGMRWPRRTVAPGARATCRRAVCSPPSRAGREGGGYACAGGVRKRAGRRPTPQRMLADCAQPSSRLSMSRELDSPTLTEALRCSASRRRWYSSVPKCSSVCVRRSVRPLNVVLKS